MRIIFKSNKLTLMKNLSKIQVETIFGGADDDGGSWMPWVLISDLMRELGTDFGHWVNGTYSGSKHK